jgi:hypothetical protein
MQSWEFFEVVAWMGEKGKLSVEEGLGEKRRYAMWRSTEIWKAQKDDREVDVRGIDTSTDTNTAPGAGKTDVSRLSNKESEGRQPSPSAASSPPNREDLRPTRSFEIGDDIWYSQVLRGCSRVKAAVVRVGWDDAKGGHVYDIAQEGGGVLRNVQPETCAPMLEQGDCLVFGDEDGFDSAMIEEVYHDHWPPRYLCLVNGGLMELEDEHLYYDEGEEVVLPSSSDDESDKVVINTVSAAEGEAEVVLQPEASGGESPNQPVEELVDEPIKEPEKKEGPANKLPEKPIPVKEPQRTAPKPPASSQMNDDVVSMTKAEKLCKSAISCMSFGDAPAAVRFLQEALDTLTRHPNVSGPM